jgi:hypothetical protein
LEVSIKQTALLSDNRFVAGLNCFVRQNDASLHALSEKLQERRLAFLSFEVGNGEHSVVGQGDVLDADEFPSFRAQLVKTVLNIFYDGFVFGLEMV